MQRNRVLLSDVDELIRSVFETHELIKKINIPVQIGVLNGAISRPYISLQPPPISMVDQIQFETLDIYLEPDRGNMPPSLLFYAGPAVNTSGGGNRESLSSDDFLAVMHTTQPQSIQVLWRLGNSSGSAPQLGFTVSGPTEIFLTRVGTQFELQASGGTLMDPTRSGINHNCSLLFHSTTNTVYYIGGSPEGVELADMIPPMYSSFIGSYQLILFGGEMWSMWDYRSRSVTGTASFVSDLQISNSLWRPSGSDYSLSFDGEGYVKPKVFASGFADPNNRLRFRIRPRSTEGLVAFLYDPQRNVSVEVACKNAVAFFILKWSGGEVMFDRSLTGTDLDELSAQIIYSPSQRRVGIDFGNDRSIKDVQNFESLNDFSQVQAWFGGVKESMLTAPFVPSITNTSFRGCLTLRINNPSDLHVFSEQSFIENYLRSNVQKGISGTCLTTVYLFICLLPQYDHLSSSSPPHSIQSHVSELGFNGTDHLVYNELVVETKPNEATNSREVNPGEQFTLALSFWPEALSGVIIVSRSTSGVSVNHCQV